MSEVWYVAQCPNCGLSISLLETNLAEIIRNRQVSATGEPLLLFVCQQCKNCFPWDYHNRKAAGLLTERPQTRAPLFYMAVLAECENTDCEAQVELIAIRPHGTTEEQILEERKTWKADDVRCGDDHSIIVPR